ncbi:alpha/beta fold hydrolase [Thermodesulfobacteriota bacterium]
MKLQKYIVAAILAVFFCFSATSAGAGSYPAMSGALDALESDDSVQVKKIFVTSWLTSYYVFEPANITAGTGFVIYPGGAVDPRAYAPTARAIAEQGILTLIVSMPMDMALFGYTRANKILKRYPDIETWAVGGHSLGGVAACAYAQKYPDSIDGVVLWASYPSETFRLDGTDLKVLSVYGTNDGLTTLDEIEESHEHLPADTEFVAIEGGNHTQFGFYGEEGNLQENDNPADITREQQQFQIVQATAAFLEQL